MHILPNWTRRVHSAIEVSQIGTQRSLNLPQISDISLPMTMTLQDAFESRLWLFGLFETQVDRRIEGDGTAVNNLWSISLPDCLLISTANPMHVADPSKRHLYQLQCFVLIVIAEHAERRRLLIDNSTCWLTVMHVKTSWQCLFRPFQVSFTKRSLPPTKNGYSTSKTVRFLQVHRVNTGKPTSIVWPITYRLISTNGSSSCWWPQYRSKCLSAKFSPATARPLKY